MTYEKLLRLLKEERKRLDRRITDCMKALVMQGDARRAAMVLRKVAR